MTYAISIITYISTAFFWAFVWNIGLFRSEYADMAGAFLREPPLFVAGIAAICLQAMAATTAFALIYPRGELRLWNGLLIAMLVNMGTVTYGALVVPGKFAIGNVGTRMTLELVFGLVGTGIMAIAFTLVWSMAEKTVASDLPHLQD